MARMEKRGRRSAASENAAVVQGNFGKRPEPPAELMDEEAEVWRRVVASEAVGWFDTAATQNLLVDYCRHRAAVEKVTEVINLFQSEWLKNAEGAKRYRELLKIRDQESRAAVDKATKLRMTNQSRYNAKNAATAAANAAKGPKPWDM